MSCVPRRSTEVNSQGGVRVSVPVPLNETTVPRRVLTVERLILARLFSSKVSPLEKLETSSKGHRPYHGSKTRHDLWSEFRFVVRFSRGGPDGLTTFLSRRG